MTTSGQRREARFVFLSNAVPRPTADPAGAAPAGTRYGWRLDAANHRPLGRAVALSSSLAQCRAAAGRVHELIDELSVVMVPDAARSAWTWRVTHEGTPVAVSAHAYLRRVECVRAFGQFTAALGTADPAAGVVRHYGPRAFRSFGLDGPDPAGTR